MTTGNGAPRVVINSFHIPGRRYDVSLPELEAWTRGRSAARPLKVRVGALILGLYGAAVFGYFLMERGLGPGSHIERSALSTIAELATLMAFLTPVFAWGIALFYGDDKAFRRACPSARRTASPRTHALRTQETDRHLARPRSGPARVYRPVVRTAFLLLLILPLALPLAGLLLVLAVMLFVGVDTGFEPFLELAAEMGDLWIDLILGVLGSILMLAIVFACFRVLGRQERSLRRFEQRHGHRFGESDVIEEDIRYVPVEEALD